MFGPQGLRPVDQVAQSGLEAVVDRANTRQTAWPMMIPAPAIPVGARRNRPSPMLTGIGASRRRFVLGAKKMNTKGCMKPWIRAARGGVRACAPSRRWHPDPACLADHPRRLDALHGRIRQRHLHRRLGGERVSMSTPLISCLPLANGRNRPAVRGPLGASYGSLASGWVVNAPMSSGVVSLSSPIFATVHLGHRSITSKVPK